MRVIAGIARGHSLTAPKGLNTRPIPDRIKEALFSSWQTRISGCRFLDLFAGSGSMGIEALSRGAEEVVFVERGREAAEIIRQNLAKCRLPSGRILREDVFRSIPKLKADGSRFDLIYLDPPFTEEGIFLPVLEALSDGVLLADGGLMAIRARKEMNLPDRIGSLQKVKRKTYGISSVYTYEIHI